MSDGISLNYNGTLGVTFSSSANAMRTFPLIQNLGAGLYSTQSLMADSSEIKQGTDYYYSGLYI